ncbi:hypothetical protein WJX84_009136 [Apatococcus fuscideae]|uniref:Uncharacterized protein n=1 Tax=Apatococcus fuscideae TaxID=2026836 RepID=A0AAW1T5L2_9CHLO
MQCSAALVGSSECKEEGVAGDWASLRRATAPFSCCMTASAKLSARALRPSFAANVLGLHPGLVDDGCKRENPALKPHGPTWLPVDPRWQAFPEVGPSSGQEGCFCAPGRCIASGGEHLLEVTCQSELVCKAEIITEQVENMHPLVHHQQLRLLLTAHLDSLASHATPTASRAVYGMMGRASFHGPGGRLQSCCVESVYAGGLQLHSYTFMRFQWWGARHS